MLDRQRTLHQSSNTSRAFRVPNDGLDRTHVEYVFGFESFVLRRVRVGSISVGEESFENGAGFLRITGWSAGAVSFEILASVAAFVKIQASSSIRISYQIGLRF